MFNVNKALLSIITLSVLSIQTTQPINWGCWITNSSIYEQGTQAFSRLSKTDAYKKYSPYGNWLLKKANKHKVTIAACVVCLFIAKRGYSIYKNWRHIQSKTEELKGYLDKSIRFVSGLIDENVSEHDAQRNFMSAVYCMQDGAKVNTQDKVGRTALYIAVKRENLDQIKELYTTYKADPDIATEEDDTARKAAQQVQNIKIKAEIIDLFNGNNNACNQFNEDETNFKNCLMRLHKNKNGSNEADWETIQQLIEEKRVKVNYYHQCSYKVYEGKQYCSALYMAIENKNVDMVEFLIEHQVNVNNFPGISVGEFITPIYFAAEEGYRSIFDALAAGGANKDQRDWCTGRSALDTLNDKSPLL